MNTRWFSVLVCLTWFSNSILPSLVNAESRGDLLIIQGSAGSEEFGQMFTIWSERWIEAAKQGHIEANLSTPESANNEQKQQIKKRLDQISKKSNSPLWIVMIGHGTFDGRSAKLNLAGPDLSAKELDAFLAPFSRTIIAINCTSSSAPFIEKLSQRNRIIITSTRSGEQINFSRFGEYLSSAISNPSVDLDKDKQVSLLEAFLIASRKTMEFYEADGRIPTENALIDDNGDGKGTSSNAFQGVRAIAEPEEEGILLDGFRAHQIHLIESNVDDNLSQEVQAHRNELEQRIELLRLKKESLDEETYYMQLESLFLELGKLLIKEKHSDKTEIDKTTRSQ